MRKTTVLVLASSMLTASVALAATTENTSDKTAATATPVETRATTATTTTTAQPSADTIKLAAPTAENTTANTSSTATTTTTPTTKTITLYATPDTKASVVATVTASSDLLPIFYPPNSTWVKVADPSNGNVGWVEIDTLKQLGLLPTANGMLQSKVITTTTEQSSNGPIYKVVEYSSGPQKLTPTQANAIIAKVQAQQEQVNAAFQANMQAMINQMHQLTNDSFSYFPMMQPIIVVPVTADTTPSTAAPTAGESTEKSSWWQQLKAKFNHEPAAATKADTEPSKS